MNQDKLKEARTHINEVRFCRTSYGDSIEQHCKPETPSKKRKAKRIIFNKIQL